MSTHRAYCPRTRYAVIGPALLLCAALHAQGVRIGPDDGPVAPSALLQLDNSGYPAFADRGFIPPNVALTRTDQPGPVGPLPLPPSLLVFNTATTALAGNDAQYNVYPGFYAWDGVRWLRFEAGVGLQTYTNCSGANKVVPYQAAWVNGTANAVTGLQSNAGAANFLVLEVGDRVFIEASGAIGMTSTAGDATAYTDVEVELVYAPTNVWVPAGVLARTTVSLDTRVANGSSSNFFLGLFTSSSSGFSQRAIVQNWSLAGYLEAPVAGTQYKFWIRMRKLRNVGTVSTGDDYVIPSVTTAYDLLQGCMRTEVFRH